MKLVLTLAHAGVIDELLRVLANAGIPATQIVGDAAVGSQHFAAVIAGVEDADLEGALCLIQELGNPHSSCGNVTNQPDGTITGVHPSVPDHDHGEVVIYVLPIRRFERIGYA